MNFPMRVALGLCVAVSAAGAAKPQDAAPRVTAVPQELRSSLKLDPWYEKHTHYKGFPILSSGKVSDAALLEARYIVSRMLADRDDIVQALIKRKARVVVMAPTEMTTDVPEQRNMKPKEYWDKRARGLGGRITSCGEENLLNLKGDRYARENILIHEFAHCIHEQALRSLDPKFDARLRATYARAMDKGLWKNTYAATNHKEYWAEGVQSYFDCNNPPNGVHNDVNTREELAKYDPDLFQLIDEVFQKSPYRYVRYDKRYPRGKETKPGDPKKAEPPKIESKKDTDANKPDDTKPQTKKLPEPPDLRKLLEEPAAKAALVVRRYEADRGSLSRFYDIPGSPARHARLSRFYASWLAALAKVDAGSLRLKDREELAQLHKTVQKHLDELHAEARSHAELAPLVPFAPVIVALEESRRRMEPVEAAQAAGKLVAVRKQVEELRKQVEEGLLQEPKGIRVDKALATRAADTTGRLRKTLKNWFSFYYGYDPLFTWWVAKPYMEADEALQAYAAFLREKAPSAAESTGKNAAPPKAASVPPGNGDAPDIGELLAAPQSELAAVIDRFQEDRRGGLGRLATSPFPVKAPRSPERTAEIKKFYAGWIAALEKLDFDRLSQDGKVDYLLFKNSLENERQRLGAPAAPKGKGPPRDKNALPGRPIGREALIRELRAELIPYTPEEILEIAEKEFAWCEAEMKKASRAMGFGDDWKKALEKVKTLHVAPGKQPELIRDLAREATDYLREHGLVTVPPIAEETWRMEMMSPERQLVNPFFTGGEVIRVSYPTDTMDHEARLQSMRGNNIHFSRATVHHELIPGHHLQGFMNARHNTHRRLFRTPFWTEGWALYWEFVLYDRGFAKTPEDRVGFLFWRMHRCARIVFSFSFHTGKMTPEQCVEYLVERVGHERDNATAEVRRSFAGGYGPLYQAAYMLGGLQIRELRKELVESGKMKERDFHDAILRANNIPITMVRALLTGQELSRDRLPEWRFYGAVPAAKEQSAR